MCFRPASTTMGARVCLSCHYVCDDVTADVCPQCGEPFESKVNPAAPKAPITPIPAAQTAPEPPVSPKQLR